MNRWVAKSGVDSIADLTFERTPVPVPGPGEVRIRVKAVSLNARDLMVLEHGFMRLPDVDLVLGSDVSGTVDALGEGVAEWQVGDHVVNLHFNGWLDGAPPTTAGGGLGSLSEQGVLAEYIVLPADRIAAAPSGYTHPEAACLPCAGVTAWNALMASQPIGEGDNVLVIGTGGVAISAMMIARGAGAEVIQLVRRDDHNDRLQSRGIETIINSATEDDWGKAVAEATGGVTKVINTIGFSAVNPALAACAYGGEVAVIGLRDQEGSALGYDLFGKSVRGIMVGSASMYAALKEQLEASGEKPVIERTFPLSETNAALEAMKQSGRFGKIVVTTEA
ncbi:NADPH:quinone reductase-like Zn-dependent oxidoreductase [Neolewinella xylanilytica]|uniref:NADPH:quinone reductase-like Zn-dependent oxidoreductase n=2 Tax=Neolewinella xylanilytica TaxID=1514080 RepID=A0A2S6I624_9BACT|nr:NADPH:quinone reductase-like Zn-dependent oxidoreductase [Neolewinella xylanilytica]